MSDDEESRPAPSAADEFFSVLWSFVTLVAMVPLIMLVWTLAWMLPFMPVLVPVLAAVLLVKCLS